MSRVVKSIVGGFLIGAAQIIPGVSGGTIALVLGIYERLVRSIKEGSSALGYLLRLDWKSALSHLRLVEWLFLVLLTGGALLAVILLANLLEEQVDARPTILAGLFLGLVVGSVVLTWRQIASPTSTQVVIALATGAALFWLLGFGDQLLISDPTAVTFFLAGALAATAMILPGISGSLILLVLGVWTPALGAVTEFDTTSLLLLAVGAVVGLALFSQVLNWALENHHAPVMAALVGLMAGSTRVLWPWPDGVSTPEWGALGEDWPIVVLAMSVGLVVVYLISKLALAKEETVSSPLLS